MGRVSTAIRAFFRILTDRGLAADVASLLDGQALNQLDQATSPAESAKLPVHREITKSFVKRSDALTLLAVLQREARLIDFLKENISGYADEQIGSAVREIHRDASACLERLFSLKPAWEEAEGAAVTVRPGFDAGQIKLVGNVTGTPPYSGTLVHPGWAATKVDLPEWNGADASAHVIAPAEVELK